MRLNIPFFGDLGSNEIKAGKIPTIRRFFLETGWNLGMLQKISYKLPDFSGFLGSLVKSFTPMPKVVFV